MPERRWEGGKVRGSKGGTERGREEGRKGGRERGREGGREKGRKGKDVVASFHTAWYDNTQHYAPTSLRHSLNVGVGESDKGECSGFGGDGLVKENTVHSAGEVQL